MGNKAKFGVLALLALGLITYALWVTAGLRNPWVRHDWSCFYAAARIVARGDGPKLYDRQVELTEQAVWDGRQVPSLFLHPPFEVVLFVPFAELPQRWAHVVWGLVSLVVLALVVKASGIAALGLRDRLVLIGVCFMPLMQVLADGQDGVLLLACFTLSLSMFRQHKDLIAGTALGLGLFRFADVVPFLIVLALARRWRAVAGAAAIGALYTAVSVMLVGIDGCKQYIAMVLGTIDTPETVLTPIGEMMPNFRGLAAMVWGDRLPWFALAALIAADLAVIGVTAYAWRGTVERAFGLTVCASLLTAPHGGGDTMLVMIPCLIALESRQDAARETQGVFGYPGLANREIVEGR